MAEIEYLIYRVARVVGKILSYWGEICIINVTIWAVKSREGGISEGNIKSGKINRAFVENQWKVEKQD